MNEDRGIETGESTLCCTIHSLPIACTFLFFLAISGCDMTGLESTDGRSGLGTATALGIEDQRERLVIDLQVPSLVCKDLEKDTLKPVLFDPEAGASGPFYAIEKGNHIGIEVRDRASYGDDGPPWSPVDETGTVPGGHTTIAKIPFRMGVSITGFEDQQRALEKYSSDLPTEITVSFRTAQDLDAGTKLYTSNGDRRFKKTWTRGEIQNFVEDNDDLPMQLIASWNGGLNALQQGVALGKPVMEIKMPEGSRFLQQLRVSSGGDVVDQVSGRTFEIEGKHGYALNQSPIENAGDRFSEFTDKFRDEFLLVSLVAAAGGLAAGIVTTVAALGTGTAAAIGVALFAFVEVAGPVCDLSGVCNVPDSPGALAKATLNSATSFFAPKPKQEIGGCDFNGDLLEIDPNGNNIRNAGPAFSGPFSAIATEPRRTLEEVRRSATSDLSGFSQSDAAWVDMNRDGNDELVVSGNTESGSGFNPRTTVYQREDLRSMGTVSTDLPDVGFSSIAVTESGSQGEGLLAIGGFRSGGFQPVTEIYRVTDGEFEKVGASNVVDVGQGDVAWEDYDQDGDPDLLVSGYTERSIDPATPVARLYQNTEEGFEEVGQASKKITDVGQSEIAWAPARSNSQSDLVIIGTDGSGNPSTQLYNVADGDINQVDNSLPDLSTGAAAWGDYTGDSIPDLAITGRQSSEEGTLLISRTYINDGDGNFTPDLQSPAGFLSGDVALSDFSGDGDVDLLLSGNVEGGDSPRLVLLRNLESGGFGDVKFFKGARSGSIAQGDLNSDQRPDFALTGESYGAPSLQIYRNVDLEE
jgi:hypothetical protein